MKCSCCGGEVIRAFVVKEWDKDFYRFCSKKCALLFAYVLLHRANAFPQHQTVN